MENNIIKVGYGKTIKKLQRVISDTNTRFGLIRQTLQELPKKNVNLLREIMTSKGEVNHQISGIVDDCMTTFIKGPMGKDLNRIVAHIQISRSIERINRGAASVSKFLSLLTGKESFETTNVVAMIDIIRTGLTLIEELISHESVDKAMLIYGLEKDIDRHYHEVFRAIPKLKDSHLLDDEQKILAESLVIAVKTLEKAGDELKEVATLVVWIITGSYIKESNH